MEDDIEAVLSGRHVATENRLDFQSQITEEDLQYFPITKRNVCYICSCVLFNEEGQVLLVQEAKMSCYGQWYLPAGRLEPKETLIDGARRELKEEAGLECDFTTLLCVEINHVWIRFTFTGKITGGKLKTMADKDEESLQAQFFNIDDLPHAIRCNDIIKLVKLGKDFWDREASLRHPNCVPVIHPHKYITHRFVIIDRQTSSEEQMHVLTSIHGNTSPHIPCVFGSVIRGSHVKAYVSAILFAACSVRPQKRPFDVCGILGVEHRGTGEEEDGLCITYMINLNVSSQADRPPVTSNCYIWHPLTDKTLQEKLSLLSQGQIVPLL